MTTGKLKGPVVDQIIERFLDGTPLKFSGVQLHIAGRLLTLRIESDDALQKVFEGTADERLEDARAALDRLSAASAAVKAAVEPLQRRYVLIERFSSREICEKMGDAGEIRWKPGYPSDTNLGAGEEERGEIAEAAERLKTPLDGPMVDSFIKGAPFDYEGARFKIIGNKLTVRIESNDELQKVFEGSADERLERAQSVCSDFIASSAAIREAVAPLDKRYVLTERFSNREICEKNGEDGEVDWMPGYPIDSNLGADDGEEHSLDAADNLMSTREALIVIGNLFLMVVAAAAVGGATYLLGSSFMPDLAPLVAVFAVVFFVHSFLVESVVKTILVFIPAAAAAWVAIRYIPLFEVSYSLNLQIAGDIIGLLVGLATGKPLAYIYRKIETR